jgi:MFS family permease
MALNEMASAAASDGVESRYAWLRLGVALLVSTIAGVGMWSMSVALPFVQADFGVPRADASLPYTLTMIGFGVGTVASGWLVDRFGTFVPVCIGAILLGLGYFLAPLASGIGGFGLAQGALIGVGASVGFSPLVADTSMWFDRRRGLAVALCASGNYFAGVIWPLVLTPLFQTAGWRWSYGAIGVLCLATLVPLSFMFRRAAPAARAAMNVDRSTPASSNRRSGGAGLQMMLIIAGLACCVAMAMPQVHIVAYCGDLGYGVARGSEMLSLMLAFGIVSRLVSGVIADRIGGVRTLLLGSFLQGVALTLYLAFDGLTSLYIISALFGLFQGGIVPSYALIVREFFSPREAGTRLALVLTATMIGMALGGWMSGVIFDMTGSYRVAFLNGIAWNVLNLVIAAWLVTRARPARMAPA